MSTTETAVVTGASHGIGAGLVTRFLEKGYNVVGNSRAISDSTNLPPSPRLALVDGDIGDCATAQKITDTAIARFGRIDVLVNNAGLLVSKPFVDYTPGDFEALVSTILAGFFYITQSAAKQMLHQQSGHIVNISTSVVDQPIVGVPCALQVLAKGGLHAVTRALAIEYAGQAIRINTVGRGRGWYGRDGCSYVEPGCDGQMGRRVSLAEPWAVSIESLDCGTSSART